MFDVLSSLCSYLVSHFQVIMGIKVQRPRCFLDIGISNVLGKKEKILAAFWYFKPCVVYQENTRGLFSFGLLSVCGGFACTE